MIKKTLDARIKQLQNQGFSVYYYHSNQLGHYDPALLDNLTAPGALPSKEALSRYAGLPVDELFVLTERFSSLFCSGYDAESDSELSELFSLCPREQIQSVSIDSRKSLSEINAFISECPTINHLFLPKKDYEKLRGLRSHSQLSKVDTLDLDLTGLDITSAQLADLLVNNKIKFLNLDSCGEIADDFTSGMDFSELTALDLSHSSTPLISLASIAQQALKLKELKLACYQNLNNNLPESLRFPELETLDLNFSGLKATSLATILAHSPKLKRLNLYYYQALKSLILPPDLKCLALEELDFSKKGRENPFLTMDVLNNFLLKSPNIKRLNLNGCDNLKGDLHDDINFSHLEELSISQSSLSSLSIAKLLTKARGLKKLEMQELFFDGTMPILYLPELEVLDLSGSNISHENLDKLIAHAPKLKYINLSNCDNETSMIARLQGRGYKIEAKPHHPLIVAPARLHPQVPKLTTVDADTRPNQQTFNIDRIFTGKPKAPEPDELRYQIFDGFVLNEQTGLNQPFILKEMDAQLGLLEHGSRPFQAQQSLYETYASSPDGHYFCRTEVQLTSNWQALPSAFPDEILKQFYINPSVEVEFAHSERSHLYYIRLKNQSALPQSTTLEMLLTRQNSEPSLEQLPKKVGELVQFCQGFREKALEALEPNATAQAYLDALIQQRVGACRHRSIVFKHLMNKECPDIPVRLVANALHMFAEVYDKGQWIRCDLGGYAAEVQFNPILTPAEPELGPKINDHRINQGPKFQSYFADRKHQNNSKIEAFDVIKPSDQFPDYRKTLVNTANAEATRLLLQKTARGLGQEHYYIDSPEALRIAGPYIRRRGLEGHIENKPGGPLFDFINAKSGRIKNIIIDYNAFSMAEFASLNGLLDDPPSLDTIPLPPEVHIIGLLNQNNPEVYQGADFYSRFSEFKSMVDTEDWPKNQAIPLTKDLASAQIIELCGGDQWEAQLIGHWILDQGRLVFKEGSLLEALKANQSSFCFNHAPLNDPKFLRFMHDLTLHGRIIHQDQDYGPLPQGFNVRFTEGLYLPDKDQILTIAATDTITDDHVILNQANLSDFLGSYRLNPLSEQLMIQPGLIEQHKNQTLAIYLSNSLSFFTWIKLLEACAKHQTVLQLTLAPDVNLPKELEIDTDKFGKRPTLSPNSNTAFNPPLIVASPDMTIDISELKPDELLARFKCRGFNSTSLQFEFSPIEICPWKALDQGQTVVLKGEWTQELADAVQTIMFRRLQNPEPKGQLIIFSDTPKLFKAFPETTLPDVIKITPKILDKVVDYEQRLDAVEAALEDHPFVLITGASGIGKTHFISHDWKAKHPNYYYGEQQIINFLEDQSSEGLITLYINEANLAHKQWSMFEGLFNNPPAIFYNNHYYPITARHKIIFDGNPISDGGERQTPSLFQHHPYQLHFKPLDHKVLMSMIGLNEPLSQPILDLVMYMATLNPEDTLLTARELKMMGSLVRLSRDQYPHIPPEKLAHYFAYTLCENHVPQAYQDEFKARFYQESPFKISDLCSTKDHPSMQDDDDKKKHHYLINETNLSTAIALESHLLMRDYRRNHGHQPLGMGLGGLVIEGESGEGKSQLVLNQLRAHGYKAGIDFIQMTAKSTPDQIKEKLLSAFHQGQIVVIDEINSLPMPELLLNALLEGHDLQDAPPKNPGFLLLGTQNPITYRGRLKATLPLAHRLQKIILPTSTLSEKKQILDNLGLPSQIAQDMLDEFAQSSDLTFREVIKVAKSWLKHHKKRPPMQFDTTNIEEEPDDHSFETRPSF